MIQQKVKAVLGKAMALQTDAEIWWVALEEHYQNICARAFARTIDEAKPRWIPRRLWNYLHKGVTDE